MGWEESPHGILPGSIRRGVRGHLARFGSGSGTGQATQARQGPHLHGCSGRDREHDARRGQTYALQARQAIAALRRQEPAVGIEIHWCPAHKGVPGNEAADEWAKLAASEPDDHRVEWLARAEGTRLPVRPTSLAHLRRRTSEKKWPEARSWCERRHLNRGYVLRRTSIRTRPPPGRRSGRPPDSTSSSLGMPSRRVPKEHGQQSE